VRAVLITGADGYLGAGLARRHLESGREPVLLWVRATNEKELQAKREKLAWLVGDRRGRTSVISGDLVEAEPFRCVDPATIGSIVHCAAITRFGVDPESADEVNVRGTHKILDLATRCPHLERFALVSTVYASGLGAGPVEEAPLTDRPEFANHYERSKWESEALLLGRFSRLPWQIFRVATVIADDDSGTVSRQNAVHNTLKLFYYGLLSLVPGNADTPVYLVTARFAVDSIFALLGAGCEGGVYHVAPAREETLTLGEIIDLVFERFARDESFRRRRILKPIYADEESFRLLAEGARALSGGVLDQAISSVAPFAKQLFVQKNVRNEKLARALEDYRAPDAAELLRKTCDYLTRTRWGREADRAVA
jgi:nucleoside-diphosphate-sugar epimerase